MRIGIFSDVHANIEALSAVLDAFREESIDRYVCLGDVVGYGASPNECCDLIRERCKYTILGNHDAAVAGRMDYSYYYEAARQALDFHAGILTPGLKLAALTGNRVLYRDGVPVALFAGGEAQFLQTLDAVSEWEAHKA